MQRVLFHNHPITLEAEYWLAHTDAETLPEAGYLSLGAGLKTDYEVPTILPEVVADYIRRHSPVPDPGAGRWRSITG